MECSVMSDMQRKPLQLFGWLGRVLLITGAVVALTGCTQVSLSQQRLVAKPEMSFDLTAHGHPPTNLMSQVEPGLASTAGAQAAGCTSCR